MATAYELVFVPMDEKQKGDYLEASQKILAIEGELVKISEARANAEAEWRKKENFLNTEKGKIQLLIMGMRTDVLKEVVG